MNNMNILTSEELRSILTINNSIIYRIPSNVRDKVMIHDKSLRDDIQSLHEEIKENVTYYSRLVRELRSRLGDSHAPDINLPSDEVSPLKKRISYLENRIEEIANSRLETYKIDFGVHLSNCNFGENAETCKYGDENCPALTESWSWFGKSLAKQNTQPSDKMKFTKTNTGFRNLGKVETVEYPNFATFLLTEGPCHCDVTFTENGKNVKVIVNYGKVINVISE